MISGDQTPRNTDTVQHYFSQLRKSHEFDRVNGTVEIPITDNPILLSLGQSALDVLAIVNPGLHLMENEVRSPLKSGGRGTALNSRLSSLLITPDYDFDNKTGFKGLRSGEAITLGRSPQNTPQRFRPFSVGVSREHVRITKSSDGEVIRIQDLSSKNGTFVGNRIVAEDEVTIDSLITPEHDPVRGILSSSIASERHPEENQDAFFVDTVHQVYAVFDGLGGHEGGAIASATAKESIARNIKIDAPVYNNFSSRAEYDFAMEKYLYTALIEANDEIEWQSPGAATTAVVVKVHQAGVESVASIAHVGDSRAYLMRGQRLTPLTIDHTPYRGVDDEESMTIQMRLANTESISILTPSEQRIFNDRNIVGATLGLGVEVQHDINHISVQPGDRLVLTTDGIHDNLKDSEIQSILNNDAIKDYAAELTQTSLARSRDHSHYRKKADDMTALVINL